MVQAGRSWGDPQSVKKLAWQFAGIAFVAAILGTILTVLYYNKSGWSDVGKALLTLAVTFSVGGAAAAWFRVLEQIRQDQAAWRDLLRDVVEVDQTVQVARQLIAAHKTANAYSEQYANIVTARLALRRVWLDPLVANDKQVKTIQGHIDQMKKYVDKLGEEYEKCYLPVARQELIDEEYLKRRAEELASSHGGGLAYDGQQQSDLQDPVYFPTLAWKMLRDPQRFERLVEFLERYKQSDFVKGFKCVKPMFEKRAGIPREGEYEPPVLPTYADAPDQQT